MKFKLYNLILFSFLFLGGCLLHFACLSFLPFPFDHANVFLVFIVWLVFFTTRPSVIWLSLPAGFILELFSPRPFGIVISALVLSAVLVSWALLNFLTHRSLYIVMVAGILTSGLNRLLMFVFSFALSLVKNNSGMILNWSTKDFLAEIISTTLMLFLFYFISSIFIRRLKPEYLRAKNW